MAHREALSRQATPSRAERVRAEPPRPPDTTLDELFKAVDLPLRPSQADELARALTGPVVPVEMPTEDAMTVRLVPLPELQRYDEARSDLALHQMMATTLAGGAIGFLVAAVMAPEPVSAAAWTLGACLSAGTVAEAVLAGRHAARLRPLRARLFGIAR